jgi:hypothetical protein
MHFPNISPIIIQYDFRLNVNSYRLFPISRYFGKATTQSSLLASKDKSKDSKGSAKSLASLGSQGTLGQESINGSSAASVAESSPAGSLKFSELHNE